VEIAMKSLSSGILGVYETHLPVRDLSRSVGFYQGQLGLSLAKLIPEPKIAFFWVGKKERGMLGLWESGSGPLQMSLHFAFRATKRTVLRSCQDLIAAQIAPLGFNGEPVTEPVVIGWMPAVSIYFKDPDGHSIEMLHLLDEDADSTFGVQEYSKWINRTQN
jgi:lactoylglutathione lyase